MAHGFVSYSQPNLGNFGKYLGEKVKSAAKMAGEERKHAKEQAEKQRKEGVPEEEIKKHERGFFFGKALSHEFGGDLLRRTKGTFSNDPSKEQDPALSKQQRFSALVRGGDVVSPEPYKQLELPLGQEKQDTVKVEDKSLKSWLSVVLGGVQKSYDNIADKIGGLTQEESKQVVEENQTTKTITKLASGLSTIKNFFNKNNKIQEEENKIESKQLELALDTENKNEMAVKESSLEAGADLSSGTAYTNPYGSDEEEEDSGNRGLLDRMLDFGFDRNGRRRRKGFKRRYARRKFNNFKRGVGRRSRRLRRRAQVGVGRGIQRLSMSQGGVIPQAPFVPTPVAQNNISPSPRKKLAGGGIVDNPTKINLNPGQAVIPLNRNNPFKNIFQQQKKQTINAKDSSGKKTTDQIAKAVQLPAQAAGGLLLSTMAGVFKRIGGIGKIFAPFLMQLFNPLARVFGLPANVIGSLIGGQPAAAATLDSKDIAEFLKSKPGKGGKGGSGGGTPSTTPPPTGGADLGASMRAGETIQAQGANDAGGFIQGGSGLGSEGGQNTTGGYATHYHLSPPSNDPAGWAQSRSVALTAARMMLARGSKIYFGNLKQFADPAKLEQQIAAEQQAHTEPGRTQGGIDMQESSSSGSMALKFPLKVTNMVDDISGGSGRTARIMGTNVRLAHGAKGSANSIEGSLAANPAAAPLGLGNNAQPNGLALRPQGKPTATGTSGPASPIFTGAGAKNRPGTNSPAVAQPSNMAFSLSSLNPAAPFYGGGNLW